jgi:flagellar hook-associated protein 1 FlgK
MAKTGNGGLALTEIRLANWDRSFRPTGGKLAGLLESRDQVIPEYLARLDEFARTIATEVNRAHLLGYGLDGQNGRHFFDPSGPTAATIKVTESICDNLDLIAASADGSPGNGDVALGICDLRLQGLFGEEGATADDYYGSLVGDLGIRASRAAADKESQNLLVTEISTRRESVKGVSIDEEMTNLVASQHAYQAAVKLVTVIDDLMGTIMDAL